MGRVRGRRVLLLGVKLDLVMDRTGLAPGEDQNFGGDEEAGGRRDEDKFFI